MRTCPSVGKIHPDLKYLANLRTGDKSEPLLSLLRFIQRVPRNPTVANRPRTFYLTYSSPTGSVNTWFPLISTPGLGIWVWTVGYESIATMCTRCATPLGIPWPVSPRTGAYQIRSLSPSHTIQRHQLSTLMLRGRGASVSPTRTTVDSGKSKGKPSRRSAPSIPPPPRYRGGIRCRGDNRRPRGIPGGSF